MAETLIACLNERCDTAMDCLSTQSVPDATGQFHLYECPTCHRKAGLVHQAQQGLSQHAQGWIENELKEKGFVFPSDFSGGRGPRDW